MKNIESHNQCPDCLTMNLETIPVAESSSEFELYLTCEFNQQQENILDGKIKFGIRGGELKLTFKNVSFSPIKSEVNNDFLLDKTNTFNENETIFSIRCKPDKKNLDTFFHKIKLGIIQLDTQPNQIEATFIVQNRDIHLTDIEGLWRHDINPNKHGILDRKIAYFIYETRLNPYLSYSFLASSDNSLKPDFSHPQEQFIQEKTLELKNIINQVYEAKTNDLLELAEMAKLNPNNDFAGGNFVATELSGIDLSNANLQYINFRGANLTDADLSESNLMYAKLMGADLSGAYLEDANLTNVNLRLASLVLANLINADLTGANLTDVNLTNTSLANIKIQNAIFANNIGLTIENQNNLKSKGAIFTPPKQ